MLIWGSKWFTRVELYTKSASLKKLLYLCIEPFGHRLYGRISDIDRVTFNYDGEWTHVGYALCQKYLKVDITVHSLTPYYSGSRWLPRSYHVDVVLFVPTAYQTTWADPSKCWFTVLDGECSNDSMNSVS